VAESIILRGESAKVLESIVDEVDGRRRFAVM
jgi:hypothetical protein